MISVIVPVFNEEKNIQAFLKQFKSYDNLEIIVVDGQSTDQTAEKVTKIVQKNQQIKLVQSSELGRAKQMNYGAALAKGEILLFLHADTILPVDFASTIAHILNNQTVIMGAFKLKIDSSQTALRFIEQMVNLRSRLFSLPYGDQGFFLTQANFQLLDGFADLPIMEDFDLVQRAKKQGQIAIADSSVTTSDRRWQKLGVAKTTVVNQLIILGYYLNIAPEKLKKFYSSAKITRKV